MYHHPYLKQEPNSTLLIQQTTPPVIIDAPTLQQNQMQKQQQQQKNIELIDEKEKRKQSLEKNRLAAYRCRERKKNEQQQMVDQADFLTVQNESLQMIVGNLRNEIIHLRELLLAHDTCDCERVHSFIQRTSSLM